MDVDDYKAGIGSGLRLTYSSGYRYVSDIPANSNVFDVTAPAGHVVVLHCLNSVYVGGNVYSVKRDGVTVITGLLSANENTTTEGRFIIGAPRNDILSTVATEIPPIIGKSIQVVFVSGVAQSCAYGYSIMEIVK